MKAAFALLTDMATFNAVSREAWRLHRAHRTGLSARRLPPHVSLKQPFDIDDLDALEDYMAALAGSIEPFRIVLEGYGLWEIPPNDPQSGVLYLPVRESETLRAIHSRLNRELEERFGERRADFDGDAYTFHLTIAAGSGTLQAYRAAFADVSSHSVTPREFETGELALFVYEKDDEGNDWQYVTYKVLQLGRNAVE